MAIVNIDEDEYNTAIDIVNSDKVLFPTLKNYVSKAVREFNNKNKKRL